VSSTASSLPFATGLLEQAMNRAALTRNSAHAKTGLVMTVTQKKESMKSVAAT
jgi:hypothetical protein